MSAEKSEAEKQKNRQAMMMFGAGCAVLVFLFGCLPFAAVAYFWFM